MVDVYARPPDGGWGWFVVVGCLLMQVLPVPSEGCRQSEWGELQLRALDER